MIDAARLRIFELQLSGLCEEMGATLVCSALSSNIKERRDSSTAVFDAAGNLLAQAAHIPVHLGSMEHAVRAVLDSAPEAGELWVLNDPYAGGTHLPDITLVRPVDDGNDRIVGYAACRAHHADVGGVRPGSMVALAAHIDDEGVRIAPTRLGTLGDLDEGAVLSCVAQMRQPAERIGDLQAQAAALATAARRLPDIVVSWGGITAFEGLAANLLRHAEAMCRAALSAAGSGSGVARRALELPSGISDPAIACTATLRDGELTIDLRGSSPQVDASFNCPRAVTRAAVMFVVRAVFGPDMPASAGAARPVHLLTTPGTIVDAQYPAAVAAGNVEVSSVIVDVVTGALGAFVDVRADGQGTMNNLVIGNDRFSYYETIAGGQGASREADGPSAVQVAMTNTRNTPVEALEYQFPLEVVCYAIRRGSGGAGKHRGGDGVIRAVRLLEACDVDFLAQRRVHGPAGRAGGSDGLPGEQSIDGAPVDGTSSHTVGAGAVVEVRTPGGGGFGFVSEVGALAAARAGAAGATSG